jgi:hypothetical protein
LFHDSYQRKEKVEHSELTLGNPFRRHLKPRSFAKDDRKTDYFLAHAAERARAGKRGGGCQWVFLDDDAAEDRYQLAAPEGMTADKIFDARWAAAILETAFARLRGELQSDPDGKRRAL